MNCVHIADVHIQLQKELLDDSKHALKPDEAFLKSFARVLESAWPSLGTSLTLTESEVEKMKREVSHLSKEEQALHMLKQWVSGEQATYGELFRGLKTISLFQYATHADSNVNNGQTSKPPSKFSACQAPSTQSSIPDDSSGQSPSCDHTTGNSQPQVTSSQQISDNPDVSSLPPPSGNTPPYQDSISWQPLCNEQLRRQNSSPSVQPTNANTELTSTSQLPQSSSQTSRKHSLQDGYDQPVEKRKK